MHKDFAVAVLIILTTFIFFAVIANPNKNKPPKYLYQVDTGYHLKQTD